MAFDTVNRRSFLKDAAALGAVPLVGTARAAGPYQSTRSESLKGAARSVIIPTHEWEGDLEERLDFPPDWEIEVLRMKGHGASPLTSREIGDRLDKPAGARPLREIAAGKRRAAITFDDLTRPTPAHAVVPWVLGELKAGGIKDEDILFVAAYGSHRAMTLTEIQKKLGKEAANGFGWLNHNVFDNCRDVGFTAFKNRIRLNQSFLAADVKVTISGVKGHEQAGLSGGAKAILPGLASIDTIDYNHRVILPGVKTAGTFKVFKNEMRHDMIEAARLAKVDFSVQVIINQRRKPVHVFSGDIVAAHQAAARVAVNHYVTPGTQKADIVVSNAYPVNNQSFRGRWWIDRMLRGGGTGVLIVQHPLGPDPIHWLSARAADKTTYFDMVERNRNAKPSADRVLVVYSQYLTRSMMDRYPAGTRFAARWEEVVAILRERHKGSPRVLVYPYGGMQEEEIPLDG